MAKTEAQEQLLKQIKTLRDQLDPEVLRDVALRMEGKVAYDKGAARKAVEMFLANRHDQGNFAKRLLSALKEKATTGES